MRAPLPEIDKVNKVNKVRSHRPSQPRHCSHTTDWTRGFWASQPQRTTLASAGIWHSTHHLHHPQLSEAPPTPSCVLVSDGGSQTTCAPAERSATGHYRQTDQRISTTHTIAHATNISFVTILFPQQHTDRHLAET